MQEAVGGRQQAGERESENEVWDAILRRIEDHHRRSGEDFEKRKRIQTELAQSLVRLAAV